MGMLKRKRSETPEWKLRKQFKYQVFIEKMEKLHNYGSQNSVCYYQTHNFMVNFLQISL